MNKKVSFHELAEFELNDAAVFFENERVGLGSRFLSEMETAVAYIREHPQASPVITQDIRRKVLRRLLTASCMRSNQIGFEFLPLRAKNADHSIGADGNDPFKINLVSLLTTHLQPSRKPIKSKRREHV
jgi:hypothetical protein